jgi:hypothetical protein
MEKMAHIHRGDHDDDRFYPDRRRRGCEPRDQRAALEALSIFHESFPDTLAAIQAEAREVLALAQRLDAAAFQDGDGVSLRLMLWRLDRFVCDAEEDVQAYYGDVPAPRRGSAS